MAKIYGSFGKHFSHWKSTNNLKNSDPFPQQALVNCLMTQVSKCQVPTEKLGKTGLQVSVRRLHGHLLRLLRAGAAAGESMRPLHAPSDTRGAYHPADLMICQAFPTPDDVIVSPKTLCKGLPPRTSLPL